MFLLSVICIRAVLAVIMLVLKFLRCRLDAGIDGLRTICHLCHLFEHDCIVNRFVGILAPCEGSVILAEHCGNRHGILTHTIKLIHDQMSGVFLVGILDLFLGQTPYAGHLAVDIIRMRRAVAGNASARLGPARRLG